MPLVEIPLVVKPDKKIAPRGDHRTQVRKGDTVIFRVPTDARFGGITFSGPTPFGQKKVEWGVPLIVVAAFDAGPDANNVYPYDCSFELNGERLGSASGGEMEIIKT